MDENDKKILTEILKLNKIEFAKVHGNEKDLSKKPIKKYNEKPTNPQNKPKSNKFKKSSNKHQSAKKS